MGETNSGIVGEDRQSYFQVLERPSVHPGHCLICGNTQRRCVQLAPEVDYADLGYGALLLCETCILQAASKFIQPANPVACDHAEEFNRWKQAFLDELRTFITGFAVNDLALPVWGDRDSVSEQAEPENVPSSESAEPEFSGPTKQTKRDNRSEGPDRLSGDPNDGQSDDISRIFSGL